MAVVCFVLTDMTKPMSELPDGWNEIKHLVVVEPKPGMLFYTYRDKGSARPGKDWNLSWSVWHWT
jgi:hypothetical protein